MSIGYVLRQAGFKTGLDTAVAGDRNVLLRFLNEAAMELYEQADLEGTQMEQVFQVDGDQQIAFPSNVGPLRAMREYSTHVGWDMHNMRPRYNKFNWVDRWRNWRLKGTSPIMYPIANQSHIEITVEEVETPPIVVSVLGPTEHASLIAESVTMDAVRKFTVNNFTNVVAIKKDRSNNFDVTLKDVDDNTLSIIPNNQMSVRYRLVDVSLYPWSNTDQTISNHLMEVLYKQALPWYSNDEEEFVAQGYDNILVNKMLQLYYEEAGQGDKAAAYDAKATRSSARKREDNMRGAQEEAAMVENPHDTLLPRNRNIGPFRYTGQVYY